LQAFVAAVRHALPPAVTGAEGVASLEIAIRCLDGSAMPAATSRRSRPRRVIG